MSDFDLIVRAKKQDHSPLALGITDGRIIAVGEDIQGSANEELNHPDWLILPGWIDAHVHFNEPGRSDWEGITSGSLALAKGGGTTFFDMPLNSSPPVLDADSLNKKRQLAEQKSQVDFALWGGLTPNSIEHLPAMAAAGAIGFKAFMCPSGLDEFPFADPATLRAGMKSAHLLDLPIAVHAELDPPSKPNHNDMSAWLDSRPRQFELDAISLAIDLAHETACSLHIVHVSTPEGIALVTSAKQHGVNVTAETCPHYLLLDRDDAIRIGPFAKCAPPLRDTASVAALRHCLLHGQIDTLGSDHSPAPLSLKQGNNLFAIWGGIAGIQHGLPLLLDQNLAPLNTFSSNVATRFHLPSKGQLAPGFDADFTLVRRSPTTITKESLVTTHPISPYIGFKSQHQIIATYLRGSAVSSTSPRGRFLRPQTL